MPAFLIWGFWLASSAWARGAAVALAGWTKFAALLLAPLWLSYPNGWRLPAAGASRSASRRATLAAFSVLLLEPDPLHAARVFVERTFGFQLDRESPFSIWGWGQYHAKGVPDLHAVQQVLEVLVVAGALLVAFVPAAEVDPPARGAHRRGPDRLRARADALVLPLHPLVLPLRRLRRPLSPCRAPRRFTEVAAAVAAARLPRLVGRAPPRRGTTKDEIVDIPVYADYGNAIEDGDVPYRDFRPEYPPGALPAFALPALVSDDEEGFRDAFEWLMAACGVALRAAVRGRARGSRRVAAAHASRALALVGDLPAPARLGRPDALRSLSGRARRRRARGARLAARPARPRTARRGRRREALPGSARPARRRLRLAPARAPRGARSASVWPRRSSSLVLPPVPRCWRRAGSRTASATSSRGRCRSRASARRSTSPRTTWSGSTSRCARATARRTSTAGAPAPPRSSRRSPSLAALVWIWLRRPGTAEELVRWSAAALVAFVALGKVLSPQFLIWLAPVVPLVAGVRGLRASVLLVRGVRPHAALVPVALLGSRARARPAPVAARARARPRARRAARRARQG